MFGATCRHREPGVAGRRRGAPADTVIAGTDPVAVDAYGATPFGISGHDVPHVVHASRRGLGEIDLGKVRTSKI